MNFATLTIGFFFKLAMFAFCHNTIRMRFLAVFLKLSLSLIKVSGFSRS